MWPGARGESEGARVERGGGARARVRGEVLTGSRVEQAGGLAWSWRGRRGSAVAEAATTSPARRQGAGRGAAAGRGRLAADVGEKRSGASASRVLAP